MFADLGVPVTVADQDLVREVFDAIIDARLETLETSIRRDLQATADPDAAAQLDALLDAPPSPDADWRPISLEEVLATERGVLERWRDQQLGLRSPVSADGGR